jgi:hypothetical protein
MQHLRLEVVCQTFFSTKSLSKHPDGCLNGGTAKVIRGGGTPFVRRSTITHLDTFYIDETGAFRKYLH